LKPGAGWLAANLNASNDQPVAVVVEGGVKISPNWAAYGDAWLRPTVGEFGTEVGARYKSNLDLFVGAQGNTHGDWGANAGVRWSF
jgi:hypothetical protein